VKWIGRNLYWLCFATSQVSGLISPFFIHTAPGFAILGLLLLLPGTLLGFFTERWNVGTAGDIAFGAVVVIVNAVAWHFARKLVKKWASQST
jgi:membrane protein DedA with SNARE-associated domain